MSATLVGPDRWLRVVVRVAGMCIAAILTGALVVAVSLSSRSASSGAGDRRADTWAAVPIAARQAISGDIGRDQSRFAVGQAGTDLVARGLGISTIFSRNGAVVQGSSGLSLQLGLEAIGRGRSRVKVDSVTPIRRSNTVTYNHSGIDEWYVNGPLGLEQGFTVDRRPGGKGELTLAVARVPTDARALISAGRNGLDVLYIRNSHGGLRYSDLRVTDARGRELPARISLSGRRILVSVSDAHARYPLRIDPTVSDAGAQLTATDTGASAGFGTAVAVSDNGGVVVVGAPGYASSLGAVYVFTEPITGGWQNATQTAELTARDGASGDEFGDSVAVSADGSTIIAGAPGHASGQGAAYVFSEPSSGGWQNATQTAELTVSDGAAGDEFGDSAAISDDGGTVVAGAPDHEVSGHSSQGAAYVFTKPESGGWQDPTETAELTASDGVANDRFAEAVAVSADGSTVVAGSPQHGADGAVYAFSEPAAGGWVSATQTAELTVSNAPAQIGQSVGVSGDGDTVAVAAPYYSVPAGSYLGGQAYIFSKPVTSDWEDSNQPQAQLGGSGVVALSGSGTTLITGYGNTDYSPGPLGANVYSESASGWQSSTNTLTLGGQEAGYGLPAVAISEDGGTSVLGGGGATVQVFPPLPTPISAPTISGNLTQGQTLTVAHGSWSSNPTSYYDTWERCDPERTNCSQIASGESYTLTEADAGSVIAVAEAGFNITGSSGQLASSTPTDVVVPLPPLNVKAPTVSGTAGEGGVLTASPGSWSESPTSFSYQWEDCNAAGSGCFPIPGATEAAYTLGPSDIGATVAVAVVASNAGGASAPASSAVTTVVPESGPVGLEIDNGDYATDDPNVTIEAAWPVGTQSMLISNNGGFRTDTKTVSPAISVPWTLEQTGSDRLPKTVYVRFLGVGQDDINFTDDIILDEIAPTIQSATVSGPGKTHASAARASKRKTYKLRLKAKDQLVGVCRAATNRRRSARGEMLTTLTSCRDRGILRLSRTLDLKRGTAPRYVRVQNSAGDWSRWLAVKSSRSATHRRAAHR